MHMTKEIRSVLMKTLIKKDLIKFQKTKSLSYLFLIVIGGDQAHLFGTCFLMSLLNVGKRIANGFEIFFSI